MIKLRIVEMGVSIYLSGEIVCVESQNVPVKVNKCFSTVVEATHWLKENHFKFNHVMQMWTKMIAH